MAETLLSPSILEAIPDAIAAVNRQGVIVQVNSQAEAMFAYTRDEMIGQRIEMLVPERQRPGHGQHREEFHARPKIRRMGSGLDLYGRRRDGSEFPVEISLSPVNVGDTVIVLSAIRDVTDRKRTEEELRRANEELERRKTRELRDSQNRMALIVDSSQDAIIGKNLDGIITQWNKGAEQMYGYTALEIIGQSITVLCPKDRADEIPGILQKIREGQRVDYFESIRITKDGRRLNVSISVSPIHDEDGRVVGASAIARNITAQKKVEEQLWQSQKMEAVGRLAGGVAHDFNNILGIVTACTELLRAEASPESLEYIDNIREAAKRGASLTKQMLAFSRKQQVQAQLLDLNERLREVMKLLRPLMGDDIDITLVPRSPAAIVEVDPGQLDQVVMNLAVNARDAMPRAGKLIIESGVVNVDETFTREHPTLTSGRYVLLAISDNGVGMDEATRSRIFEPFFTTKEVGKGTGLGLATVYGIVKQSGGDIWVYSEPNRGTTFKIYFPSAEHKLVGKAETEAEALPPRRDGVTILIAEDDPTMRRLTRKMLEQHGYRVIEADDGKAALDRIAAESRIDLVLTDVVMKKMNGPELVLHLMNIQPDIKVVYMSGYTGELMANQGLEGGFRLLEKPFTRLGLLKALDSALD
ncbi:MAG TPA: PAS domain S-box protein [Candidatus Sulfotelmatobacter sp.]|nr:PAS domain S-box protein [Candidatus Sulfotelmatobacter sp.]